MAKKVIKEQNMKRVYKDICLRPDISISIPDLSFILNDDMSILGEETELLISEFYERLHELTWSDSNGLAGLFIAYLCKSMILAGIKSLGRNIILELNKTRELLEYSKFKFDIICNLPKNTLDCLNTELEKIFKFTNQ